MSGLLDLKTSIGDNGLEAFSRFYGHYPAIVDKYDSKTNKVTVTALRMFNDSNLFENVPLQGYPNFNIPLVKGDYVILTFLWGVINYPLVNYAFHSDDKKSTTKDEDVISQDYVKFKSKKNLLFEELKDGFRITKGKVKFEMTEKKVTLSINGSSIALNNDYIVKIGGNVELKNNKRNKMVSFAGLMSTLRNIQTKHDTHFHPISIPVTGGTLAAGSSLVPSPSGMIYHISDSTIAVTDIYGG